MSERHQKTYIPVREFIESWDKELYELTNLDYFIYLMINYLGNNLEKRFFIENRSHSDLFLDFDRIGTVSFNLGDAFEYFLEENCFGSCPVDCLRDLDGQIDSNSLDLDDSLKRKLEILQSFLVGKLDKEQCLRLDLMNNVILDTLLQFYNEEMELEIEENNLMLLELAEFIENVIIDFIRFESQPLLNKPFNNALEYFEALLQSETEEKLENEWSDSDGESEWGEEHQNYKWEKIQSSIDDVFLQFLNDEHYNPKPADNSLAHDINYLNRYLKEYAGIEKLSEFEQQHLAEFLSTWLAREFVLSDAKSVSHVFRATARFVTFLYHHYQINLKREFLKLYDTLKTDLPRVIQATNAFISDYNLLEAVLVSGYQEMEQKIGYFEVLGIHNKIARTLNVKDVFNGAPGLNLKLDSSAFFKVHKGDIIHASIINKTGEWEILEIQYIYPRISKNFITG
ncbi:MAG: hypothetical protein EH225_07545 [Calditrichaeota bacterium]|nr:hypothetical protein [Calditrichota bacterium]RQW03081.1 MAG: hypothetical protein EH225_07545 [Calditrichota bacterium]